MKVQMAARIPKELKDELMKVSIAERRSLSNLLTLAIVEFLERKNKRVNFLEGNI